MGKDITVTGYFGVGSSAVLDLLMEYSCNGSAVRNKAGGYEHTTFYHPGGLFDLEDKLLFINDMHRSDEALRTFEKEMLRLNDNNFGWYGSFQTLFGNEFKRSLEKFINALHPFELNARYYGQCQKVIFNPIKIPLQFAAKILLGRTIYKWGRQFIYNPSGGHMRVAFPTEDEFYEAAKEFVRSYLEMYHEDGKENTLFDRLLLCQHLCRLPRYFDDDFRVIRVRRDVRDVYILSNYLWKEMNAGTMYPMGLEQFLEFWKRLNNSEEPIGDSRILEIYFEDLIYNYEETVRRIELHCGLTPEQHVHKKKIFNPEKSIKNTQVYKLRDDWKDEIQTIMSECGQYLYPFPYEIKTEVSQMFDDSTVKRKKGLFNLIRK